LTHELAFLFQPSKPSTLRYQATVAALVIFSLAGGYYAGTAAKGQWSFFAWHPMLMTCGMVGLAGIGAMTKKLGGYNNTKVRITVGDGVVAWYRNIFRKKKARLREVI
jgi:hypothetical protein